MLDSTFFFFSSFHQVTHRCFLKNFYYGSAGVITLGLAESLGTIKILLTPLLILPGRLDCIIPQGWPDTIISKLVQQLVIIAQQTEKALVGTVFLVLPETKYENLYFHVQGDVSAKPECGRCARACPISKEKFGCKFPTIAPFCHPSSKYHMCCYNCVWKQF